MTNIVQVAGNQGDNAVNTGVGYSPFIWNNCPIREIRDGTTEGWYIDLDMTNPHPIAAGAEALAGNYYGFASTGGLASLADEIDGGLTFSSDGDDEGASLRSKGSPFQISRTHGSLWFEARFKSSTITDTKHGIFVGLAEAMTLGATLPIQASGVIADKNLCGFHRLEGDGDQLDAIFKADTVTAISNADVCPTALVAATYVKVGIYYNAATYLLTYYVNGVSVATKTITAATAPTSSPDNFPVDVRLGLYFAVLNATATTPGNSTLNKMRCYQLAA